jgi:uncharacterized delta-60 repeat protein
MAVKVTASGVAGAIDTGFGEGGFSTVALGTWLAAAGDVIQPDGKIIAAGEGEIDGATAIVVTRMDGDGHLDQSFGDNGVSVIAPPGGAGMDSGAGIALQSDGKIVIAGTARYQGTGPLAMAAVRLLPNGTPDPAFGHDGVTLVPIGTEAIANAVAVEPDGKILLGGGGLIGDKQFAAIRLNPDGSPDSSFGTAGVTTLGPPGVAWGMAVKPDGKILLGGEQDAAGSETFMAAQLLPSGAVDQSFGDDGVLEQPIGSKSLATVVALQPDGRAVIAGSAVTSGGIVGAAFRLLPDGSIDPSFGSAGIATFPDHTVNATALDSSGRIVIAGVGATVTRLRPDGNVDRSFGDDGIARATLGTSDAANGLAIDPATGDLVLAGVATISGRMELCVSRLTTTRSGSPSVGGSPDEAITEPEPATSRQPHARGLFIRRAPVHGHKRRHRRHRRHRGHRGHRREGG